MDVGAVLHPLWEWLKISHEILAVLNKFSQRNFGPQRLKSGIFLSYNSFLHFMTTHVCVTVSIDAIFSKISEFSAKKWNCNGNLTDWFRPRHQLCLILIYYVVFTSNLCFHNILRTFIMPVKNADVNKIVNIFAIFLRYFTDDKLKLLCAKFTLNWTNIKKIEKNTTAVIFQWVC